MDDILNIDEVINELTEARYTLAKQEARDIWKNHGREKVPVDLDEVIQGIGIPVQAIHLERDGLTRMDENGLCFIMYNNRAPLVRQRFTLAHEIGHVALDHVHLGVDTSQCFKDSREKEANAFASELLIPSSDLKKFVKNKDKTMQDIIQRYQVSNEAAFWAVNGNKLINKIKA